MLVFTRIKLVVRVLACVRAIVRTKWERLELFWSAFYRIRTEYEEIRSICPYPVLMRENVDQNNSNYGYFLRSEEQVVRIWENADQKNFEFGTLFTQCFLKKKSPKNAR